MVDTGFFILGNRERPGDPRTELHAQALLKLEESQAMILIAAPSLAELFRRKYTTPPPATRWPTVSFGRDAAKLLGERLPERFQQNPGIPGGYWKYDVMIAACAIVAKADALLVADHDYTNIMAALDPGRSCRVLRAIDIVSGQLNLPTPMLPAGPTPLVVSGPTAVLTSPQVDPGSHEPDE